MMMLPAFLGSGKPASTIAKPACIQKTSASANQKPDAKKFDRFRALHTSSVIICSSSNAKTHAPSLDGARVFAHFHAIAVFSRRGPLPSLKTQGRCGWSFLRSALA
jgi:hypothetical protein